MGKKKKTKIISATRANTETATLTKPPSQPLSFSIAFWGLAIVLFASPFYRGLFFPEEQYRALILVAIVFWFVWLGRQALQETKFLEHPLDCLMLALPLVYVYSAFFAVNTGYAVNEIVRNTMYFMAFWAAARVITSVTDAIRMLHVVYYSAILVALAGLATATGIIEIKDGFLSGRIYSTFQYPNALATYLSAVFLLGMYLWNRAVEEGPQLQDKGLPLHNAPNWLREFNPYPYYYAFGNLLLFAVFLGTKSQGGFLIFALVFPLLLIKLRPEIRLRAVVHTLLIGLPALLAVNRFLASVAAEKNDLAWLWVILGLLLVAAGQAMIDFAGRKGWLAAERGNLILKGLGGLVGLAVVGGAVAVAASASLQERLSALIKWHNAEARFNFMGDAWEMIVARPLTGWGGGGWKEAYQAFQNYFYTSREVHGHYFQVGVESGIIGVLILVGIWAAFLWAAHRLYHAQDTSQRVKDITWIMTMAAILIGLHAAIDFDLSLSALTLVLFTLFGTVVGLSRPQEDTSENESKRARKKNTSYRPPSYTRFVLASAGALAVIVFASCLAVSQTVMGQALGMLQSGNYQQGVAQLKRAEAYNPANSEINYLLAQVYQGTGDHDAALTEINKALARSKYNAAYYMQKASIKLAQQRYDEAVQSAEQGLAKAPLVLSNYEQLTRIVFNAGYGSIETDPKAAKGYLEQVTLIPARMEERMKALSESDDQRWKRNRLTPTTAIRLPLGKAQYLLGDFEAAAENLEAAGKNENLKAESLLWLALVRDAQGNAEAASDLLTQVKELNPELVADYERLKELPLPETSSAE